jgi:CBS domain-containing protein
MNAQQQRYRTVADLMQTDVVTIRPEATIVELAALLRREGISAVPVVEAPGRPIGIASASDLLWICESLLDPAPTEWRPRTVSMQGPVRVGSGASIANSHGSS